MTILKPANDDREYKFITLPNKLQVLLISDPNSEKSAAAMDVGVGHFSDPKEVAGLAHFCEHMLFLGTEKYPEEGSYQAFLKKHGGTSNAYTDTQHTNYYFDVTSPHLEQALDRFSQFFIAPLFTESATLREMNAVDSENKKNLLADGWRVYQLLKSTASPDHPFSKFGTGNLTTLLEDPTKEGVQIREALVNFHSQHYSANIMRLVVLGAEPLETLEDWVTAKFSPVPNKDVPLPTWNSLPYEPSQLQTQYSVVPVKQLRSITLYFQLDESKINYLQKPIRYVSHLVGHEGPGSILAFLKAKGWLNSLSSGVSYRTREFALFSISMDMTEAGEDHVNEIIGYIFQYFNMLRRSGVQKWIWEECADVETLHFRFKEKTEPIDYVCNLANNMHKYSPEHVLCGSYLFFEYNEQLISEVIDILKPENVRIHVTSKRWQDTATQTERWYGTKYSVERIPDDLAKAWMEAEIDPALHLPAPNPFIPKSFDIYAFRSYEGTDEHPQLVKNSNYTKLWFKQDRTFKQPKANLLFSTSIPLTYASPHTILMARLYSRMVVDALNEYAYDAEVAGIDYDISVGSDGIQVKISGYNDKIALLAEKIFEKLKTVELKRERFELLKERLHRQYKNFTMDQPYQHAMDRTSVLILQQRWHYEEYLAVLPEITFEQLASFAPLWLSQMHTESLIHGNLTQEHALAIIDSIEKVLYPRVGVVMESQRFEERVVKLKDRFEYYHEMREPNDENINSSLELLYQIGVRNTREDVILDLMQSIVSSPFYEQLRTTEQIGYLVWSRIRRDANAQFWTGLIQSPNTSPVMIAERIEAFLVEFRKTLEGLTEADFNQYVQSLITRKLEKPKELLRETTKLWREISRNTYRFDREHDEAKELKKLTKEDLLNFFDKYIASTGECRRRLAVMVFAKQHEAEMLSSSLKLDETPQEGITRVYISDPAAFKRDMPFLPASNNF